MWRFTRRSTVLGFPIGPRRTDWWKVGRLGTAVVAFVAGLGITRRLFRGGDADELPRDESGRFLARSEDEEQAEEDDTSRERAPANDRRAG